MFTDATAMPNEITVGEVTPAVHLDVECAVPDESELLRPEKS